MVPKITSDMDLVAAFRQYKSKEEMIAAFRNGKDFYGDVSIGCRLCSVRNFEVGTMVTLHSNKNHVPGSFRVSVMV